MAVLVTRPGQNGIELCVAMQARNIDAIHHPLIQFEPFENNESLLRKLHTADVIIAVSQHAVYFTQKIVEELQSEWPRNTSYLAIGQKTAYKLGNVTQQKVHYPSASDSEHFVQLPQLQAVDGQSIVILRGDSGRELIFDTLSNRKANVEYAEVYRRTVIPFNADDSVRYWRSRGVESLIVTSGEQLDCLEQPMTKTQQTWLHTLRLLVPSKRIATLATGLGYKNIVNTSGAANSDFLNSVNKK